MSDFQNRRDQALALLRRTGMRESSFLPPAVRLLWRLGIAVPPPHFAGFLPTLLVSGAFFGLAWGVLMWLMLWRSSGMAPVIAVGAAATAGLLFGLFMALYYAHGRRKHRLPRWDDLA